MRVMCDGTRYHGRHGIVTQMRPSTISDHLLYLTINGELGGFDAIEHESLGNATGIKVHNSHSWKKYSPVGLCICVSAPRI